MGAENGSAGSGIVRFGVFEVDLGNRELRKHGVRVRIQDQPFKVLEALLEQPGRVVSREDLVRLLWPDGTVVEYDRGVNAAINRLRQVLSDTAENPRYVETVARRGYRFVAPVERAEPEPAAPGVSSAEKPPQQERPFQRRRKWLVAALLILAAAAGATRFASRSDEPAETRLERLTNHPGLTTDPALSPDGNLLAYVSDAGDNHLNLWLRQLGRAGGAIQITHGDADVRTPAFSPDGTKIAFRSEQDGGGIYILPALGGEPTLLATGGRDPRFSPDGKWVAYWTGTERTAPPDPDVWPGRVSIVPSSGGIPVELGKVRATEDVRPIRAAYPVWAPDGHAVLAFEPAEDWWAGQGSFTWWILPVDGGRPREAPLLSALKEAGFDVHPMEHVPRVHAWRTRSVVFSAKFGDSTNLWEWDVASSSEFELEGRPRRLTSGTNLETAAAVGDEGAIVFASLQKRLGIWTAPLDRGEGTSERQMRRVVEHSTFDLYPSVSAEGDVLAYNYLDRGGDRIRVRDARKGSERELPSGGQFPIVSPNGAKLAYSGATAQDRALHTVPIPELTPARLVAHGGRPWGWSPDGSYLLFGRYLVMDKPRGAIHRWDAATGKESLFLAGAWHVFGPNVSPDGKWVSFDSQGEHPTGHRVYISAIRNGRAAPPREWIAAGFKEGWDDKARWSADGRVLYFLSQHDGFRCVWAQRLQAKTKAPAGEPFAVFHSHGARLSLSNVGWALLDTAVSKDEIFLTMGELTGELWARR